jgi:enhancing lycopene biosynthesis protein 2
MSENHSKTLLRFMMNLIKKAVLTLIMAISFGASNIAFAEDAKATEVIGHIEAAIAEIGKHDFNAAYIHEKAARGAAEGISGNEATVKQGVDSLIKAQIIGKSADEEKAVAELNKALSIFKSL